MKKQHGGQPNSMRRLPSDFYRTRAWSRILKYSVAPELSLNVAEKDKTTNKISEEFSIDLSPTQWKDWWEGNVYPNKTSTDKFIEATKDNKNKEIDELIKLLEWLKPISVGYPLQRHFLAIDTCINAYSLDKNKKDASLENVTKIMDALHKKWAPSIPFGKMNYADKIAKSDFGVPFSVDNIDFEFKISEKAAAEFSQSLPNIYDPFNKNSVLVFMLSLALYNLLPSYHHYKHWTIDFISGLMAMYAYRVIKNMNNELISPSIIGNMTNWCEQLLKDEMDIDDMIHPFRRSALPIKTNDELLTNTLLLIHTIYHEVANEIGLSLSEVQQQWNDSFLKNPPENTDEIPSIIGTLLGQQ